MSVEAAVRRGLRLAAEGARLGDVGAESTLLQASRTDADEQNRRLLPVVEQLSAAGVLVSVETYQPAVTEACLDAGAAVVNLTAGRNTDVFYRMAAEHQAGIIICHVHDADNVRDVGDFQRTAEPCPRCTNTSAGRSTLPEELVASGSGSIRARASTTGTCKTAPSGSATRSRPSSTASG